LFAGAFFPSVQALQWTDLPDADGWTVDPRSISTRLTKPLSPRERSVAAADTALFPSSGTLLIDNEFIAYRAKTDRGFASLRRGVAGKAAHHGDGAEIFLARAVPRAQAPASAAVVELNAAAPPALSIGAPGEERLFASGPTARLSKALSSGDARAHVKGAALLPDEGYLQVGTHVLRYSRMSMDELRILTPDVIPRGPGYRAGTKVQALSATPFIVYRATDGGAGLDIAAGARPLLYKGCAGRLLNTLQADSTRALVEDAACFPEKGYLAIGTEILGYGSKGAGFFAALTRGVQGTTTASQPHGEAVLPLFLPDDPLGLQGGLTAAEVPGQARSAVHVTAAGRVGVGTSFPTRSLYVRGPSNNFEIESFYGGTPWLGGRLGPLGLITYWNIPGRSAPGDYIGLANAAFLDSNGEKQEYAEIGVVLVNPEAGQDEARFVFSLRGRGATLPGQGLFSVQPVGDTGATLRWGKGTAITSTEPFAGGGYLHSNAPDNASLAAGASYVAGMTYRARAASPSGVSFGVGEHGVVRFFADLNVAPGAVYTPTERLRINPGGEVGIGVAHPPEMLSVAGGGVFNVDRKENRFRVMGVRNEHLFYVDGAGEKVGVGAVPRYKFHVVGAPGELPQMVVSNFDAGKGRERLAVVMAQADEGALGVQLKAGRDAEDRPVEFVGGASRLSLGFGGFTKAEIEPTGRFHVQPVETADAELEVSDGRSPAGGAVHAARFAYHARRDAFREVVYLTEEDRRQALKTILRLKPARLFPLAPGRADGEGRLGLVHEDVPPPLQGLDGAIVLNDHVIYLQGAFQALAERVIRLEAEVTALKARLKE